MNAHARMEPGHDTAELELQVQYFKAATAYASKLRGEQLLTATYRLEVAGPVAADDRKRDIFGFADDVSGYVELPLPPLQSVTFVKYYDAGGTLQTLTPNVAGGYRVMANQRPAYIVFDDGLPVLARREDALQVTFVTGYGVSTDVPDNVVQAIRTFVAECNKNRENTIDGSLKEVPISIDRLLTLDRWR